MKRRILFVDDNQGVLALFRRVLPYLNQDWEPAFAVNGKEGLAVMAQNPVDIVVSDIDMPEMNGIVFLDEVEKKYPKTVRFVFSSESVKGTGLHLAGTAHQYFQKPDGFNVIKSAVERVYSLFHFLPEENLRRIIGQISTLPTLPDLYTKVTKDLEQPEPSVDRIGALIAQDVAMSAKLLQVVNSAFFGMRQRVGTPAQAVSLLGLDLVKSLVLMLHAFQENKVVRIEGLSLNALWRHSLAVAQMAHDITLEERMGQEVVDLTCSAGLFHDIGKLILMVNMPESYAKVLTQVRTKRADLSEVELEVIGASHGQVGAYLLGLWGFDDIFVKTCLFHHTPSASGETKVGPLTAIHVANVFDHLVEPAESGERPAVLDEEYMNALGIKAKVSDWLRICVKEDSNEESAR